MYVDLVGMSEVQAKQRLLDALKDRAKPTKKPTFPSDIESVEQPIARPVAFPRQDLSNKPSAMSRFNEKKVQSLEQRLKALEENWEAVSKQLNFIGNAAERLNFERQINAIETEMTEVATQLDALRN